MTEHPLRILMLAPTPYFADRGCHVRIFEEARSLVRLGHQVRIVTYHLGRDLPEIPTDRIMCIPWYRKLAAGPSWHKPYLDLLLLGKALLVARTFRPDLIHAHLHEGAFIGILLKKLIGRPLLFDCQGSLTGEMADHGFVRPGSPLFRLFGALERFINRAADGIITSSGPGAAELVKQWGVPVTRVLPLCDGVDTDEFRPGDREAARRRLGLPLDRPVVAFLGIFNRYQGLDLLLEVIALLKKQGVAAHFLLMGFPDERYRQLAQERGIAEAITFTGRIDYRAAAGYLAAGNVAVSPKISLTEANGKLFNYLACGLPCLVFETPINREILGEVGVYARYGDPVDFAEQLIALLADHELREELSRRGREKALADYSWQSRGESLVATYRRLLTSPTS
ncbi:MAG TPA: glycosyltransferase family 4 protein [Geobacteraceae bacterium]